MTFEETAKVLTEAQRNQALADARICRCGRCFVCHVKDEEKQRLKKVVDN